MRKFRTCAALAALLIAAPAYAIDRHCLDELMRTEKTHIAGPDDVACFKKMLAENRAKSEAPAKAGKDKSHAPK